MSDAAFAALLAVTLSLIELHAPNGATYFVNPAQITTLRQPMAEDRQHFAPGTHCVVVTTSGKFLGVRESCAEIYTQIMGARR